MVSFKKDTVSLINIVQATNAAAQLTLENKIHTIYSKIWFIYMQLKTIFLYTDSNIKYFLQYSA